MKNPFLTLVGVLLGTFLKYFVITAAILLAYVWIIR